jgi:hypothetical protein
VFAYGRMPLAFSARCFTARHCNLPKDDCQLQLHGTPRRPDAQDARERRFSGAQRHPDPIGQGLQPDTVAIIALFDAVRNDALSAHEAQERMQGLMPDKGCNGYWYGQPGLDQVDHLALAA